MRKPSSQAYPLTGNKGRITREQLYDFEINLWDIIAELTKPIYEKI